MHSALQPIVERPLTSTVVFALVCLVVVATGVPGRALGIAHAQLAVYGLVGGPAVVAVGVFYAFSDDENIACVAIVGSVCLGASFLGLFVAFFAVGVISHSGPYLSPGHAGPYDVYLMVDNAVQFLVPTVVLSAGAALCTRFRAQALRLAVLVTTGVVLMPATAFAATIVPELVL